MREGAGGESTGPAAGAGDEDDVRTGGTGLGPGLEHVAAGSVAFVPSGSAMGDPKPELAATRFGGVMRRTPRVRQWPGGGAHRAPDRCRAAMSVIRTVRQNQAP